MFIGNEEHSSYVELRNIDKRFGQFHASDGVSFAIEKGKLVGLLGPSGSGKTTILRMIAGLEQPDAGDILIDGVRVNDIPAVRRGIGFVFQNYALFRYMRVFDNIAFALRVVGAKEKSITPRVEYLLKLVGLQHKTHSKPSELSGGEQQRVAIARALANQPDLIIADEPTGNIDPRMSQELVELFVRLNESGTTVVMVTHAHDLVRHYNKRVIILDKGVIAADGGLKQVVPTVPQPQQKPPARTVHLPPKEAFDRMWES
jgi:sulfate transport system ATP-binding protein